MEIYFDYNKYMSSLSEVMSLKSNINNVIASCTFNVPADFEGAGLLNTTVDMINKLNTKVENIINALMQCISMLEKNDLITVEPTTLMADLNSIINFSLLSSSNMDSIASILQYANKEEMMEYVSRNMFNKSLTGNDKAKFDTYMNYFMNYDIKYFESHISGDKEEYMKVAYLYNKDYLELVNNGKNIMSKINNEGTFNLNSIISKYKSNILLNNYDSNYFYALLGTMTYQEAVSYLNTDIKEDSGRISKYLINKTANKINLGTANTMNFDGEGTLSGYFGIDVKNDTNLEDFKKLVTSNFNYGSVKFDVGRDLSQMTKPKFVIFKLGATYTSSLHDNAKLADDNYKCLNNVKDMVRVCENEKIPYGFYYYSQATSDIDVDMEAKYIKNALDHIEPSTYNVLPLSIDVEESIFSDGGEVPTRVAVNAQNSGVEHQTKIVNDLMNKVRDEPNLEVNTYLSRAGCNELIDHTKLDATNQKNCWIVDPSAAHANDFATNYKDVVDNTVMRQVALDGIVNNVDVDVNFIDSNYYNNLVEKLN